LRPAWIQINLDNLKKNIKNIKEIIDDGTEIMGVIKADGYGHGAVKIAEVLRQENIKWFAVSMVEEALKLRENGFEENILILGYTSEDDFCKLIKYNLTPTIYEFSQAKYLNELAFKHGCVKSIHIKIDTGMGRLGYSSLEKAVEEIIEISKLSNIKIEGIFSHLAAADEIHNDYTKKQFDYFTKLLNKLEKEKITIPIKHIANSAAVINFPEMHLNLIRPGIILYGIYPDYEMAVNTKINLYPVMEVKAKLIHVKEVAAGTQISYGCTFSTEKKSIIGTVPLGYADGVFRQLSNNGEVLVKGKRCSIVGRVCMDQFMIDLTEVPSAGVGDEVVLIGKQGDEYISVDETAQRVDTISYEIVSRMGKRIPRIYK
jgi:alanine racemase